MGDDREKIIQIKSTKRTNGRTFLKCHMLIPILLDENDAGQTLGGSEKKVDSVPAEIDPLDQNLFVDDRYDNPAENTVG